MTTSPGLADASAIARRATAETFAGELALHGVRLPVKTIYEEAGCIYDADGVLLAEIAPIPTNGRGPKAWRQLARLIARAVNEAGGCAS